MNYPVRPPAALTAPPLVRPGRNAPSLLALTPMQDRFVEEYLIDLDPRQAAIRAGIGVKEAAPRAASWMRHPLVRDAIGRAIAFRSRRVGLNADRVLERLGALALGDPTSIFNEHGGLKLPHELNEHDRLLIAGVKTRRSMGMTTDEDGKTVMAPEEITEVKVIDQVSVLTLAMKHLGLLNEKIDVNVTSLADRLREAQLRRDGKLKPSGDVIEGEWEDIPNDDEGIGSLGENDRLAQGDGLGSGGGGVLEADWSAGADAETAGTAASPLPAPAATPGVLDYDPLATDEPAVIDWDPLA